MAYNRLSSYATTVAHNGLDGEKGALCVYYHKTCIVQAFDDGRVRLHSGGWRTVTTKRKMNQAAHQFDLGYGVYQRAGDWYVTKRDGSTVDFHDGMTL